MELRHLRYFVAVAEDGSFSRAASRLNISQPPLSRQIQDLEAELGISLFDRSGRAIQLTAAGRAFLQRARSILFESKAAVDEARRWALGHSETIRIGFMSAVMLKIFHRFLTSFHELYPSVAVKLIQMRSDEQVAALLDDRIDVGFVDFGIEQVADRLSHAGLITQPFVRDELCAAVPHGHRLSGSSEIDMADLRDEKFVILERHLFPAHHDTVITECRAAGFTPNIVHYADQIPTVLTYISAHMGVGISPRQAKEDWGKLVHFLSIKTRPQVTIHMVRRDDSQLHSVKAMCEIAGKNALS